MSGRPIASGENPYPIGYSHCSVIAFPGALWHKRALPINFAQRGSNNYKAVKRTRSSYRHVRLGWQDSYEEMGWGSGRIWEWEYISITDNGREL